MPKSRSEEDKITMLHSVIPHRVAAVEAMSHAVQFRVDRKDGDSGHFSVVLGAEIHGNANAVLNPWLEAGIIHGRALLEFMGLTYDRKNETLKSRDQDARETDWRISDFGLNPVSPEDARSAYGGPPEEADRSLVSIMLFADRSIAHMTDMLEPDKFGSHNLQIASEGIRALIERFLYIPLGIPMPRSLFTRAE
ncbi:hypothetical protein [Rhodanobacter glycinis]|uniref:hypothetical protein n=1 Tax=Rhodanobacter glycinis TaxID=582702 RepID=UPI0011268EDC|nr:hypothetical protein [Rhodanobacter glycinis]